MGIIMKKVICVFVCLAAMLQGTVTTYAGERNPLVKRLRGTDGNSVLVLMYHRISKNDAEINDFCIKPEEFEKDVNLLCEKGYTFLTATELAECKRDTGEKFVAITFDDGYKSDYEYALPILKKYSAKATFFVFGGAIGRADYMTEKQLYELAQSPNAEIGNHSFEIHNKSILKVKQLYASGKNNQQIVNDFIKNKNVLEGITKKKITALSYPNGVYNFTVDSMLRENGTMITFSTEERIERLPFSNRVIGRFNRGKRFNICDYIAD